jgi:hypothetical protein
MTRRPSSGYKPKDMIPTPWLLGIALQQDGWYLRAPIVWHKPNCMPSSVTDRPTLDYEYVLLLSKQERYYYDQQAIAEEAVQPLGTPALTGQQKQAVLRDLTASRLGTNQGPATRNARMTWSIPTRPYSSGRDDIDHFAVMPEALVERCLLAGSSPQACPVCRAPWRRVVERSGYDGAGRAVGERYTALAYGAAPQSAPRGPKLDFGLPAVETTGWEPTCTCPPEVNDGSGRSLVLDPFCGSGTVLRCAIRHGRDAIGVDLNPAYVTLMDERTAGVQMSMESVL